MFAMPLIFTVIFGGLAGGEDNAKPKIGLLVEGEPTTQGNVLQALVKDNKDIDVVGGKEDTLKQKLKDQKLLGIVKLDSHWERAQDMPITLIRQQDTPDLMALKGELLQEVQAVQQGFPMIEKQGKQKAVDVLFAPAVSTVIKNTGGETTEPVQESSMRAVGFIAMFVMMVVIVAGGVILQEKEEGTWSRLKSSPVSTFEIMGGFLMGFFLIGLLQFIILIAASSLMFGVSWGSLPAILILIVVFLIAAVSLGLFLSMLVKTAKQQQAIGGILVVVTCMIGGVFWPVDIVSDMMRSLANFVPQFWVMDGIKQVMFNKAEWLDILPQVGILALFAVILFGGSMVLQSFQTKVS